MHCMCGDTGCTSCGPAQGSNPEKEAFIEALFDEYPWLVEHVGKEPMSLVIEYSFEKGEQKGRFESESELSEFLEWKRTKFLNNLDGLYERFPQLYTTIEHNLLFDVLNWSFYQIANLKPEDSITKDFAS